MSLRPIGDRVVVRRREADTTTPGGIVLPNNSEQPCTGEVLFAGKGKKDELYYRVNF